jgi:phosphatidylinositol 4-kinase
VTGHLKTAWAENPVLAVHLVQRFQSPRLKQEVRWQVLNFPHKVISEPDALEILLGNTLPSDVSFQLKVCSPSYDHERLLNSHSIFSIGLQ